jgi:AbiU2
MSARPFVSVATQLADLKALVKAAHEELEQAIAYREAWRPAAFDAELHTRLNRTLACNTFLTIRQALHRELVLALVRLWDKNKEALRMTLVADKLRCKDVRAALNAESAAHWLNIPIIGDDEVSSPEERAWLDEIEKGYKLRIAREETARMREMDKEVLSIISRYQDGPGSTTLEKLRRLRHQNLAHRQIKPAEPVTLTDAEIEAFYEDMKRLVHALRIAVEGVDYRPNETAKLRAKHAALFWNGVRGEKTEGHPDYKAPRGKAESLTS